jgi:hypothetical protein
MCGATCIFLANLMPFSLKDWSGMKKLSLLYLAQNSFTGAVPSQICHLVENGSLTDANNCVLDDLVSQPSNSWACPLPSCAAKSCHARCS